MTLSRFGAVLAALVATITLTVLLAGSAGAGGADGSAGADGVEHRRSPATSIYNASATQAAEAFRFASPAVAELRFTEDVRAVIIDDDALLAELESGSFTMPLPDGGSVQMSGGTFDQIDAAGTAHWSITSPESLTSITVTEHGVFGTVTVGGLTVRIVPVANGVHAIHIPPDDAEIGGGPLAMSAAIFGAAEYMEPPPDGRIRILPETALDAGRPIGTLRGPALRGPTLRGPALRGFQAGPATIKTLVLLDDAVTAAWGGNGPALAQATSAINASNTQLVAAQVSAELDPVYEFVPYTSPVDPFMAHQNLQLKHDNQVDVAHTLRDSHDADIVLLLTDLSNLACGIADLPGGVPSDDTEQDAFIVINYRNPCTTSRYSIVHEIGHVMGARHDNVNAGSGTPLYPYAYGYVDVPNSFVTVMSYTNAANGCPYSTCPRIPQFSSDTLTYLGLPTGDANHNNTLVFQTSAVGVEQYRPDPCIDPPNDFFGARVQLGAVSSAVAVESTLCASHETFEEGQAYQAPLNSIWYDWTAPSTNLTRVSTCQPATDIDTVLTVWDGAFQFGSPSNLNQVAVDDDDFACPYGFTASTIDFTPAAVGTVYYFQLDGRGADRGTIGLIVTQDQCDGQFPHLYGSSVVGTSEDEVILGTTGNDTIYSLGGNDTVCGRGGADTIQLGSGNDTAWGDAGADVIFGSAGIDEIYGGANGDVLNGGFDTDMLYGGTGGDTLRGDQGADQLYGAEGNDTLLGGDGDDMLYGQGQNDELFGGAGADQLFGSIGLDLLNGEAGDDLLNGGAGDDTIHGGDDDDEIVAGSGDDTATGGLGDDLLRGYGGNDNLSGGAGLDTLSGGGANDILNGGADNDVITGGPGVDTADGGDGDDAITGNGDNDTLSGGLGADDLQGSGGNDTVHGGPGNDVIGGGPGADTLNGDDGDDSLNGAGDNDMLFGNGGTNALDGGGGTDQCTVGTAGTTIRCE